MKTYQLTIAAVQFGNSKRVKCQKSCYKALEKDCILQSVAGLTSYNSADSAAKPSRDLASFEELIILSFRASIIKILCHARHRE